MSTVSEDQNLNKSVYSIDFSNNNDPFSAVTVNPIAQEEKAPILPEENQIEEVESQEEETQIESTEIETQEEESDVNPYFYLGEVLKRENYLPEDLEVNEKIDGGTVYNAYKQKLQSDLEPQIRQEVYQKLTEEGVAPQELLLARAIRAGVDYRLLSAGTMYERNASLPDDTPDEQKIDVIKQMYQLRQFKDEEIKRQITAAEADDNIDTLFVEGKQFFAERYNEFVEGENERFAQSRQQQEEKIKNVEGTIQTIMKNGEVLGEKFSKEQLKQFEDSIRKENQVVEYNGQKYRASEMQKFLFEFENSPEMKFLMFKLFKFRNQGQEELKTEIKKEVEEDFLKGYANKVIATKKGNQSKQIKSQLETAKATASSIYNIDLGVRN